MRKALIALLSVVMAACSQAETAQPLVGGDSDDHGCKASAGYRWCARTAQCERPWELAKAKGFENSAEGFRSFCEG